MFRFMIRDVLWLTVVAAMAVAWWIDHQREAASNYHTEMLEWKYRSEALKQHLEKDLGERVAFEMNKPGKPIYISGRGAMQVYYPMPAAMGVDKRVSRKP